MSDTPEPKEIIKLFNAHQIVIPLHRDIASEETGETVLEGILNLSDLLSDKRSIKEVLELGAKAEELKQLRAEAIECYDANVTLIRSILADIPLRFPDDYADAIVTSADPLHIRPWTLPYHNQSLIGDDLSAFAYMVKCDTDCSLSSGFALRLVSGKGATYTFTDRRYRYDLPINEQDAVYTLAASIDQNAVSIDSDGNCTRIHGTAGIILELYCFFKRNGFEKEIAKYIDPHINVPFIRDILPIVKNIFDDIDFAKCNTYLWLRNGDCGKSLKQKYSINATLSFADAETEYFNQVVKSLLVKFGGTGVEYPGNDRFAGVDPVTKEPIHLNISRNHIIVDNYQRYTGETS